MLLSIIIPAHNEEKYLKSALLSVQNAAMLCTSQIEIILVANRCTDKTVQIAQNHGCKIIENGYRNISQIKNEGVQHAQGDIIVTMDADSIMHKNLFVEIERLAASGNYIGGQAPVRYDRHSMGILFLTMLLETGLILRGYAGGFYWCTRDAFNTLGGFDETMPFCEDIDFAKRLKKLSNTLHAKYALLYNTPFISSSRKFDTFGDWHYLRSIFWGYLNKPHRMLKGVADFKDGYFYDYQE